MNIGLEISDGLRLQRSREKAIRDALASIGRSTSLDDIGLVMTLWPNKKGNVMLGYKWTGVVPMSDRDEYAFLISCIASAVEQCLNPFAQQRPAYLM